MYHTAGFALLGSLLIMAFGIMKADNIGLLGVGIILAFRIMKTQKERAKQMIELGFVGVLLGLISMLGRCLPIVYQLYTFQGDVQEVQHISELVAPLKTASIVHNSTVKLELMGAFQSEGHHLWVAPLVEENWSSEQEVTAWMAIEHDGYRFWEPPPETRPTQVDWVGRVQPRVLTTAALDAGYSEAVLQSTQRYNLKVPKASRVYSMVASDETLILQLGFYLKIGRAFLWLRCIGAMVFLFWAHMRKNKT